MLLIVNSKTSVYRKYRFAGIHARRDSGEAHRLRPPPTSRAVVDEATLPVAHTRQTRQHVPHRSRAREYR